MADQLTPIARPHIKLRTLLQKIRKRLYFGRNALKYCPIIPKLTATHPMSSEPCKQKFIAKAENDAFLGQADQRPELDLLLAGLQATLETGETDIELKISTLLSSLNTTLSELSQGLQDARTRLIEILDGLPDADQLNSEIIGKISIAIDKQVRLLSRRIRSKMLNALNKVSPEHNLITEIFTSLLLFHQNSVEALAETMYLLLPRSNATTIIAGQNIYAIAMQQHIDDICSNRILAGFRYYKLKSSLKKHYHLLCVPVRDLAFDALVLRTELNVQNLIKRHVSTHDELQSRLTDGWRAIRYNLESVVVELDDIYEQLENKSTDITIKKTEIQTLIVGALDQALESIEETGVTYATVLTGVVAEINQDHAYALKAIKRGIDETNTLSGRLNWERKILQKSFARNRDKFILSISSITAGLKTIPGFIRDWFAATRIQLNNYFGLSVADNESHLQLTDLPPASEVVEHARSLPPIYRRLFTSVPLINQEFLVARQPAIDTLTDALGRWQMGRSASVAIVGPEGSGKSSLVNCFENELDSNNIDVITIDITQRCRTEANTIRVFAKAFELSDKNIRLNDLIEQLLALPRCIIRIEHAHYLFMRAVDSREGPETFFNIVMATRTHFLWLVSLRLYPWKRLEYLHDIKRYFTHIIHTEFHNEADLKQAILLRQRITGQELLFIDSSQSGNEARKLLHSQKLETPAVQTALMKDYFSRLYVISGGNMQTALYYWLQSLSKSTDGKVQVSPCLILDDSFIRDLDKDYHFTLAEIIGHGDLSVTEHCEIFRRKLLFCENVMAYLDQIRLIIEIAPGNGDTSRRYQINPIFYKQVTKTLTNLNILH